MFLSIIRLRASLLIAALPQALCMSHWSGDLAGS